MLNAIQKGVLTSSTKKRLEELETAKENIEISIAQEEMQKPTLTKEQVVFWISRFKEGDVKDPVFRRRLIDCFVNSIYLYDDRIVLTYNYKDGTKTISQEEVKSSDLEECALPETRTQSELDCPVGNQGARRCYRGIQTAERIFCAAKGESPVVAK